MILVAAVARQRLVRLVLMAVIVSSLAIGAFGTVPGDSLAQTDSPVEISFEAAITGVSDPMHAAEAPDGSGRMFVVSNDGRVSVAVGGEVLDEPFLDISDLVDDQYDESGLFSIAFHPEYADNGLFFVSFTGEDQTNAVWRFRVSEDDPNLADPESGQVVLAIPDEVPMFHNGGGLAFGPDDYLYITIGDDTTEENARDLLSLHGKLLRIDPLTGEVPPEQPAYTIPPDNPLLTATTPDRRSGLTVSGTRGASASIVRPATSTSLMSARPTGRRSTSSRPAAGAARITAGRRWRRATASGRRWTATRPA